MGTKRNLFFSVCLVSLFLSANLPAVYSQDEGTQQAEPDFMLVFGSIVSINANDSSFVVAEWAAEEGTEPAEVTIAVNDATMLKRGASAISLSDLMEGEKVLVKYTQDEEGRNIANDIVIK